MELLQNNNNNNKKRRLTLFLFLFFRRKNWEIRSGDAFGASHDLSTASATASQRGREVGEEEERKGLYDITKKKKKEDPPIEIHLEDGGNFAWGVKLFFLFCCHHLAEKIE